MNCINKCNIIRWICTKKYVWFWTNFTALLQAHTVRQLSNNTLARGVGALLTFHGMHQRMTHGSDVKWQLFRVVNQHQFNLSPNPDAKICTANKLSQPTQPSYVQENVIEGG